MPSRRSNGNRGSRSLHTHTSKEDSTDLLRSFRDQIANLLPEAASQAREDWRKHPRRNPDA